MESTGFRAVLAEIHDEKLVCLGLWDRARPNEIKLMVSCYWIQDNGGKRLFVGNPESNVVKWLNKLERERDQN